MTEFSFDSGFLGCQRRSSSLSIRRHAFIRAMEKGITPDMIEATLKGGKIKRFGKNNVKFFKEYKNFTVVCVDEIIGNKIKIVTIETKGGKK